MRFDGFVGPTYALPTLGAGAQDAVNLYPEVDEGGGGKAKVIFRLTPGLDPWGELPTAPVRALWAGEERLFAIGGSKLYEVNSDGSVLSLRGDVGDDADHSPGQMFPNGAGTELFIVSAGLAWVDTGTALISAPVPADPAIGSQYPGGQVGTARTAAFRDSVFIASKQSSKKFFISELNTGQTWNALDYETKEGYPDNVARVLADHEELYIYGDQTTEIWRAEGDADHMFRRDPSGFIPHGNVAPWAGVNYGDGPAWLAGDTRGKPIAYRARGFQPNRISTHAIEQAWAKYSKVSDAIGYDYVDGGHWFWVINFPTGNATWVHDLTTGLWHRRAWGANLDRHRGRCHAFVFNKHLVGDHTTGKIYQMTPEAYDDDGTGIKRVRTAPYIQDEGQALFHSKLRIDLDDPDNAHNLATLAWSDNNGKAWSAERSPSSSFVTSEGLRRLEWRRNGEACNRAYRLTLTQAAPTAIMNAFIYVNAGT